jgi:hypothetical protein
MQKFLNVSQLNTIIHYIKLSYAEDKQRNEMTLGNL